MRSLLSIGSVLLLLMDLATLIPAQTYQTAFDNVTWDQSTWTLTTSYPAPGLYQTRMSLANGYLGICLSALGPFFEIDTPIAGDQITGWPLFNRRQTFATISGFWNMQPTTNGSNFPWLYQYGGESVIAGVPHWAGLTVTTSAGHVLDASTEVGQLSKFASSMDFSGGVLRWAYTWTPPDEASIDVVYTALVHKLYVNQAAVQVQLTASKAVNVNVTDILDGDGAVRTDFAGKGSDVNNGVIWTAVRPSGVANVTAYIYSTLSPSTGVIVSGLLASSGNASSIAQAVQISLEAGVPAYATKYIGAASSDAFADPQSQARNASWSAASSGFAMLEASHRAEWASILTADSVDSYVLENGTLPDDPYILELHITSVTNPFQLLQNTVGANALTVAEDSSGLHVNSISVGGLGSDSYAGLIFWDADIWMSSGLVVAFPQAAQSIANYRVRLFGQAKENVHMAFSSSQNETGRFSSGGVVYPWTSGRFGNCTGTGPCFDYEYHINGDIGLGLVNYLVVTGDTETFGDKYWPVYEAIGTFYYELVALNGSTGTYVLTNATDPDEYANFVNNPGYTMALIETHLETVNNLSSTFSSPPPSVPAAAVAAVSQNIEVPVNSDANIILEYSTMNGSISVKQADVVLIDDFLHYPDMDALHNLDYYAAAQSPSGPAMTYAIFASLANTLSPSGCSSYTHALAATSPYLRAPWFQYSEQLVDDYHANGGTHPAFPFLTGAGGANRVGVYGWLGLKLRMDALVIDPSLPPQILTVRYRRIYWQGHAISVRSTSTHTTLQRLANESLATANSAFANNSIPVFITSANRYTSLPIGSPLNISNRQIGNIATWPGNIAQCLPVSSADDFTPGQFPLAMNDGAVSTKWQAANPNTTTSSTIELGTSVQGQMVAGFRWDWAQAPPQGYFVAFSNTSGQLGTNVTTEDRVKVSHPWESSRSAAIAAYSSNGTNVSVRGVWAGRWVTLGIWGSQAEDGKGATVAEFAVLLGNGMSSGGEGGGAGLASLGVDKRNLGRVNVWMVLIIFFACLFL